VRVSPNGGTPEQLVAATAGERSSSPQLLPGGKTVIFTLRGSDAREGQVVAQSIKDGSRRVLVDQGSDGLYLPSGYLAYSVGGTVFAVPFDPETLTKRGEAKPVLAGVRRSNLGTNFSVSSTGTLIYVPGPAGASQLRTFDLVLSTATSEPSHLKVRRTHYEQPRCLLRAAWSPLSATMGTVRTSGPTIFPGRTRCSG